MAAPAAEVLPQSRRPDGTLRAPVRVKKGYVPPEEQSTYRPKEANGATGGVPGSDIGDALVVPKQALSKTAQKNAKRKGKKIEGSPEEERVTPTPAPMAGDAVDMRNAKTAPRALAASAAAPDADGSGKNELDKRLRALKKKLKTIEELEAKAADGAELNDDQKGKIAAKAEIEAEVSRWQGFNDSDELSKEVKKLGKKMRQIEDLEARLKAGEDLNADQNGKIANKKVLEDELKKLEDLQSKLTL